MLMEIVVLVLSFVLFVMRSRICPTDQGEIEPSISPSSVDLKPASLLYQYLLYIEVEKTWVTFPANPGWGRPGCTPSMLPKLARLSVVGQAYVMAGALCPLPLLLSDFVSLTSREFCSLLLVSEK